MNLKWEMMWDDFKPHIRNMVSWEWRCLDIVLTKGSIQEGSNFEREFCRGNDYA